MRDESLPASALRSTKAGPERSIRIQADLESRGMAPELSVPVSERLCGIVPNLSPVEYNAVLEGVAAACIVYRKSTDRAADDAREISEMQHLMDGFASELRKLDEGLQILSAYVSRMSARSNSTPGSNAR